MMCLYEEGYMWEGGTKFMYTKKDCGNIFLINNELELFDFNERQVTILIRSSLIRKALIQFTLND